MSELALSVPASARQTPAVDKPKRARIKGKLKSALDIMVWGVETDKPLPWIEAARKAGLSAVAMRQALERGPVQVYLREQRQVLRASICASNLSRLGQIRDQDANLNAAVSAVKLLEQMDDPAHDRGPSAPFAGVVVNIITGAAQAPQAPIQAQVIENPDRDA